MEYVVALKKKARNRAWITSSDILRHMLQPQKCYVSWSGCYTISESKKCLHQMHMLLKKTHKFRKILLDDKHNWDRK
jgi:hypothetical protein